MAYNKIKVFEQAKAAIEKHNLFFIEDIVAFIPCTKTTFYEFYPLDSDELNYLKEKLEVNKIRTKSLIRAKLFKGDRAAELLSLYRLICTPEERRALSLTHQDITSDGKQIRSIIRLPDNGRDIKKES